MMTMEMILVLKRNQNLVAFLIQTKEEEESLPTN